MHSYKGYTVYVLEKLDYYIENQLGWKEANAARLTSLCPQNEHEEGNSTSVIQPGAQSRKPVMLCN